MAEQKEPTAGEGAVIGFLLGGVIGGSLVGLIVVTGMNHDIKALRQQIAIERRQYQTEAIERGFAEHDPKTGEWRWVETTKEESK